MHTFTQHVDIHTNNLYVCIFLFVCLFDCFVIVVVCLFVAVFCMSYLAVWVPSFNSQCCKYFLVSEVKHQIKVSYNQKVNTNKMNISLFTNEYV